MRPRDNEPTQEELRAEFLDDGNGLIWNVRKKCVRMGAKAGSLSGDGYWQVWFRGKNWKLHRLLWIFRNGPIPEGKIIDHINGDKLDNRAENLRLCDHSQNARNRKRPPSKLGVPGVQFVMGYRAFIKVHGVTKVLGWFDTLEEATAARKAAELKYGGEFGWRED